MQIPSLASDHRCEGGGTAELVACERTVRRDTRELIYQGWVWSCTGCRDPFDDTTPFQFLDGRAWLLNAERAAAAWQENFDEPLPAARNQSRTRVVSTEQITLRLDNSELARLDDLRGDLTRTDFLRQPLSTPDGE